VIGVGTGHMQAGGLRLGRLVHTTRERGLRMTVTLRRLKSVPSRLALGAYVPARTASWPEASRLFAVGDGRAWSIDDDRARLTATARRLGYEVAPTAWVRHVRRQAVFSHDHFGALQPRWLESSHRLGLSYFHGHPGTPGYPEFDRAYEALRRNAARIDRVQVTHVEMHELVLDSGVASDRIFRIPIGVELERFPLGDDEARAVARSALDIPGSAFVIGSFLKDGVGMDEGFEPKLLKGPDTFVAVISRLRGSIPELFVLLTGPARGYVKRELDGLGVPYRHVVLRTHAQLARPYHAADVCVVTSRQEGGPKAVLESLATGVPLVTTRVGQAPELVVDGESGLLADVEDTDALAAAVNRVYDDTALHDRLRGTGRATAEAHAEERLDQRWADLLDGFVRRVD
jgi:glycosyltransferase involved in cell wall biosynthesis